MICLVQCEYEHDISQVWAESNNIGCNILSMVHSSPVASISTVATTFGNFVLTGNVMDDKFLILERTSK